MPISSHIMEKRTIPPMGTHAQLLQWVGWLVSLVQWLYHCHALGCSCKPRHVRDKDHHRYLHHRCRRNEVAIWDFLSATCLMVCPGWTATSCPALGMMCESFEGYLGHGTAGFGAGDVVQPSRRVSGQRLHEKALDAPSSQSPLGTLESFVSVGPQQAAGGDGQHQSQRAGTTKASLPEHLGLS